MMQGGTSEQKKWMLQVFVLVVCIWLIVNSVHTMWDLWHRRDILVVRREKLRLLEEENKALEKLFSEAKTPQFIERMAREKLGLLKEGESLVLFGAEEEVTPAAAIEVMEANWVRWLSVFF